MTREDAIKTIRELKRETNDSWYEEVYDMAIEALQEQKTEKWVQEVNEMYQKAVNLSYIKKPLAWALYQVWKKHDKEDTSRRTDNE